MRPQLVPEFSQRSENQWKKEKQWESGGIRAPLERLQRWRNLFILGCAEGLKGYPWDLGTWRLPAILTSNSFSGAGLKRWCIETKF